MNKIVNKERIQQRNTKHQFTRFADENYSFPLMISELIDNAISAYEGKNDFQKIDFHDLDIFIDCFHNSKNSALSNIMIFDNAKGMNRDVLKKSAIMYEKENKGDDDLNQYGIGLKSCVFWLAQDAWVFSKTKNCEILSCWSIKTSDKSDSDTSDIEIYDDGRYKTWDSFFQKSNFLIGNDSHNIFQCRNNSNSSENMQGTFIFVENIYKQEEKFSYFYDEDKLCFLKLFLGFKYKNYIKKGMRINFTYRNNDRLAKPVSFDIYAAEIRAFNFNDFYSWARSLKNSKDCTDEKLELCYKKIDDFKNQILKIKELFLKDEKKSSNEKEYMKKIYEKIATNEDVEIDFDIPNFDGEGFIKTKIGIITNSKEKIPLKFFDYYSKEVDFKDVGIDKKVLNRFTSLSNLHGVNIFHHNRGIKIGPWIDGKETLIQGKLPSPVSFSVKKGKSGSGKSSTLRMFGYVENLKGFKTEVNKSEIYSSGWGEFTKSLNDIWKHYFSDILDKILFVEKDSTENVWNTRNVNDVTRNIDSKTTHGFSNSEITQHEYKEDEKDISEWKWSFDYGYKSNIKTKYRFSIKDDLNRDLSNIPFEYDYEENENDLSIDVNISYDYYHALWNPLNIDKGEIKVKKEFLSFMIPMLVSIVMSEMIFDEKMNNRSFEKTKVTSIFNEITQMWKDREEQIE